MKVKRKTHLVVVAVFAFIFLLLLNLISGMKASAATKYYTLECTGGSISYYGSGVTSISGGSGYVSNISCSNPGSFKITINPNTSTSSRTITLYAKKGSVTIDTLKITQKAVTTKTLSAACTGGNVYYTKSGAYSYTYSNTAVCSSRSGNYFVVKPNTSTSARSCKVTVKNSAGRIIEYVTINQAAVPVKTVSVSGGYTSFSYYKSGATNFSYTSSQVYKVTCSNPGNYTLYVTANPNASASRTFNVIAKNSSGAYLEIIKVTQAKTAYSTVTSNYNAEPRTITLSAANADYSKTVISNTAMCTKGSTSTQFKLTQNSSLSSRSCTVTFKDKYGAIVKKCVINQAGVPTHTINAACTGGKYSYTKSGAASYSYSNTAVCSSRSGSYFVVKPNTTTSARDCTVTVKNSSGKVIAYVYIKQAAVPVKTVSVSGGYTSFSYYKSGATNFSYTSSQVYKATCSNPGNYTLYVTANPNASASRTFNVIAKNSSGAYLEIIKVTQAKTAYSTVTSNYNSDPRTITLSAANADYSKTVISNTSMCTKGSTSTKFNLTQNTSTNARSCTVTFKDKYGAIVKKCVIKQAGVPTKTINAACTGGEYSHNIANAYYFSSNNTAVCNSVMNGKVVVTPNSSTETRSCTLTVKNSSGNVIAYVYIKQAAVPVKNVSLSGGYTSFGYYKSGAASFSYTSSQVYKVTCSNPGSYTLYVTANPNASASRTFNVIAKNSSGAYLEIIKVTQVKTAYSTVTSNYNSDPRTITLSAANADYSKTVISNTSMCTKGSTSTKFKLTQNTSTNERSCTVTFKDKYGAIVKKCVIKQAGVPLKEISVVGDASNFSYGNSNAVSFVRSNTKMIYNVKATNPGSFVLYVSANPSSTSNRTSDIVVKNSAGAYLEIIRVTQSKFVVPSKSESYNSDPRTVTFTCPGAVILKTTYSNSSMFKTGKSLGNGKYQFSVSQNPNSSSRQNKVTFKDQFGTPIATYTVIQTGVPLKTKTISKGTAWMIYYSNDDAAYFSYDNQNVSSISASNPGEFRITITANPSTTKNRTFDIIAKRSNGTYAEIIRVTQPPHTHNYVYTLTGDTLSRKCSICSDKDNDITYQEYLTYKNLSDSESSVKKYMSALGYASNSKETKSMVNAYNYLKKSNNMTTASKLANVQGSLQNMKSIADNVAIFANNDKLNNSLTVISAANHAYMFFTSKDNTAIRFSSAVNLAADAFGTIETPFIGNYLSSGLSTVAKALSDNLPIAFNRKDKEFAYAMIEYDSVEGEGVVENSTYNELANNQDIKSTIKELYDGEFKKAADDYFKKLLNWKASYEEQKSYEVLCKAIDPSYKAPVYTESFWDFVQYQLN